MLSELTEEEIQALSEPMRLCLPGFVEMLEEAQNAFPEIPQLPRRKQRAREAYHWYMLLAKEANAFFEALETLSNKE